MPVCTDEEVKLKNMYLPYLKEMLRNKRSKESPNGMTIAIIKDTINIIDESCLLMNEVFSQN